LGGILPTHRLFHVRLVGQHAAADWAGPGLRRTARMAHRPRHKTVYAHPNYRTTGTRYRQPGNWPRLDLVIKQESKDAEVLGLEDDLNLDPFALDLASLPKVSLHDHLDGGLRVETVWELAGNIGHQLPANTAEELAAWFAEAANAGSLPKYLEMFDHTTAVMQTTTALERIAYEFAMDLVDDGVVYGEVRWAPEQHTREGLSLDETVEAVTAGLERAMNELDGALQVHQILCAMRQNSADNAQQIAELTH